MQLARSVLLYCHNLAAWLSLLSSAVLSPASSYFIWSCLVSKSAFHVAGLCVVPVFVSWWVPPPLTHQLWQIPFARRDELTAKYLSTVLQLIPCAACILQYLLRVCLQLHATLSAQSLYASSSNRLRCVQPLASILMDRTWPQLSGLLQAFQRAFATLRTCLD